MLTQSMTPNQISAGPSPTTGPRTFCAIGAIIGRMMKAISKKSRKNARKKMKRLMKIRKPQTPPGSEVSMCSSQAAGDAQKHHREAGRADQDEGDHAGDAHGGLVALLDQVAQVGQP